MAMRSTSQEDINSLPEEYNGDNWPSDIKTPVTYVNEAVQKWGIKVNYEKMSCENQGPFLYKLIVEFGPFRKEYLPPGRSKSIKIAKQNAALQLVLNPPKWLIDIVDGKLPTPETPSVTPNTNSNSKKTNEVVEEEGGIKVEEVKEMTEENAEEELKKLVDDINNPMSVFGDIPRMPDCDNQDELSKNIPFFSFQTFSDDQKKNPEKFIDIFGDGHLVMTVLQEGEAYPDTAAAVKIHFVGRRGSDDCIFDSTFAQNNKPYEFRLNSGEALGFFDWAVSNMKFNSEILVKTSYVYAFGENGHPPLFQPKESLLVWIKLIDAKTYSPTTKETERLNSLSAEERLENAKKMKFEGNKFWERKILKLAVDQYWTAVRFLKYNNRNVWKTIDKSLRREIKKLLANLFRNISAFYIMTKEWEDAIKMCDDVLKIEEKCITSMIRKSRSLAEIQKFEESHDMLKRANELDKENRQHLTEIGKTKKIYTEKYYSYLQNRNKMHFFK